MDITGIPLTDAADRFRAMARDRQRVELTPGLLAGTPVDGFLTTVPGHLVALEQAVVDLDPATAPRWLTVSGAISASWPVSALRPDALAVRHGTLRIERASDGGPATATFDVDTALSVQSVHVPLSGTVAPDGRLRCTLGTGDHAVPDLPELVDLLSGSAVPVTLPADAPIVRDIAITVLELDVTLGAQPSTSLVVGIDAATRWTIVDGFELRDVGVTLTATHTAGSDGPSFGAALHADVGIAGTSFRVALYLGPGPWTLRVVPANGALPSLADLAGLLGDADLKRTVQSGLDTVGLDELGVDGVGVVFDPFGPKLIAVEVAGHVVLGDIRLDLFTRLPDFELDTGLPPGEKVSLRRLLGHVIGDGAADPLPDIEVTEFAFRAHPSTGTYELELEIEDDDMQVGGFGFRDAGLLVLKDDTGVSGSIRAGFTIGGAYLAVEATHAGGTAPWVFTGVTGPGQEIAIATIHQDLSDRFGAFTLPPALDGLVIDELDVRFDTGGNVTVTLGTRMTDPALDLTVFVDVRAPAAGTTAASEVVLRAEAVLGDLRFELDFSRTGTGTSLLAVYSAKPGTTARPVRELLAPLLEAEPELTALVPADLRIELKDALLYVHRPAAVPGSTTPTGTAFLFAVDLGASVDLAQLPLVGSRLPAGERAVVQDLQVVVASRAFPEADVTALNAMLPPGVTTLPAAAGTPTTPDAGPAQTPAQAPALARGLTFTAVLVLGGTAAPLTLPAPPSGATTSTTTTSTTSTTAPAGQIVAGQPVVPTDGAKWITLQRSFGPIRLNRVGFRYADQELWFLLDAGIALGGLSFSLDGLGIGSPVSAFAPEFDLRGVGLEYSGGPLTIGGALLRTQLTGPDGTTYEEYEGSARLSLRALSLTALGAYANVGGHPSLFVYAVLNYPLGGPAFFFVTGLAAGFGYNRRLIVPPIEQVAQFPLITEVTGGPPGTPSDPAAELVKLRSTVVPATDEQFLAIGVQFTSFEQISTFALLTVVFGQRFEVDVLGLSTMALPTGSSPPLAEIQMAIKAAVIPDEGYLGVQALLTSASYLYSPDCRLTGGFAFASWFSGEHAGDFVVIAGGYRPGWSPPAHYPRVPRIGINWRVGTELVVKGEMYFALVPTAVMAGGRLQATWNSGNLQASFVATVDFLLAWKPYHYEAALHIGIGVHYTYHFFGTHTLSVDVSADLSIWGPDFSGRARLDLSIATVDIAFGAGSGTRPAPLGWDAFQTSFLPPDTDQKPICGLVVRDGLVRPGDAPVDWVLDPRTFTIVTDSAIPAKRYDVAAGHVPADGLNPDFGVAPMDVAPGGLDTVHRVTVTRGGQDVSHRFTFTPVLKRVPRALWGRSVHPSTDGDGLIADTLAGFAISPQAPVRPPENPEILAADRAGYETTPVRDAFVLAPGRTFAAAADQGGRAAAAVLAASGPREEVLAELGITDPVTTGAGTATAFLVPPRVGDLLGHDEDAG